MRSLIALPLLLTACFSFAKPAVMADEPPPPGAFPHDLLDDALAEYVDERGYIDYDGLRADREPLDRYLGYVAAYSPRNDPELFPTEDDALAYYLNAYNALAVRGVLDRPEMESVNDIKVDYFYYTRYSLGGRKVSLYKLENGIIRDQFMDPRIHFYLNCQSVSCPTFPRQAIRADTLDSRLDAMTAAFVNDPDHVSVRDDGTVEMSSIFDWYAEDFQPAGGPLNFAREYRPELPANAEIAFKSYDWGLIEQSSP